MPATGPAGLQIPIGEIKVTEKYQYLWTMGIVYQWEIKLTMIQFNYAIVNYFFVSTKNSIMGH